LKPPAWAKAVTTEGIGNEEIEQVVQATEGFSGRAISKLAIAWQAAAYGTEGAVLDKEAFFKTVEQHKRSMATKDHWLEDAEKRAELLTIDA
jgi:ATPase family AAA domain-containing protein 3A/B